jgi:tetratricopeptide (TPR) repeat protein
MLTRIGRPAVLVAAAAAVLAIGGGCRDGSRSPAPKTAAKSSSTNPALAQVVLPDLPRADPPVQEQLRESFAALTQKRESARTPAAELADAHGEFGKLLLAAKLFDLAEPYFKNAQMLAPGDWRWPYYLGHIYKTQGDVQQATSAFERSSELRPGDVPTLVWLGEMHLVAGRPEAAAPLFAEALDREPRSLAARFGLGRAALGQQDYKAAVSHFEGVLALETRAVNVHYPLALAYRALGEKAKVEVHLRQRGDFEILPVDPLMDQLREVLRSAISYEIRGTRALNGGDWKTAAAEFRLGLELEPSNPLLKHKLGTALHMQGDVRGAREAFEDILRTSPEFVKAHYSLGVLLESAGRHQEAIARYSAAVAREPGYLEAHLRLAELTRLTGRLEQAVEHYDRALALDPRMSEAALGRALSLVRLGRYEEARDRLQDAVRISPANAWIAHALARLLAAAPDSRVRDAGKAEAVMLKLSSEEQRLDQGETMAMVLAERGRYEEAAAWQRRAIDTALQAGQDELAARMAGNLRLYENRKPSRAPWRADELR